MNNVDKQYIDLLRDILENGTEKDTRAGKTISLFSKHLEFDLNEGFPILTTKKVFTRGFIHELLWFLSGNTNIKYLVDNNVHIWDDDAYRYYKTIIEKHNSLCNKPPKWESYKRPIIPICSKEEFIEHVKNGDGHWVIIDEKSFLMSYTPNTWEYEYKFGDLGPVYGKQWRSYGYTKQDQIKDLIEKLKTNPDDRRMICWAFNKDEIDEMALPPCHMGFEVYTKPIIDENGNETRELSLCWIQRSCDFCLGFPGNLLTYSLLTHMLAQVCNMKVGKVSCWLGDVHIYKNQIEGVKEQLSHDPNKFDLPKLSLNPNITNIDDFKIEDIKIENYQSYDKIYFPLSVG